MNPRLLALLCVALPLASEAQTLKPPVADRIPHAATYHGETLSDPYHWLKDQSYPKVDDARVLSYLNAENAYFKARMAPHAGLVETLFGELKGRIKEDDASVPVKDGAFENWSRFEPGGQYKIWLRRPVGGGAEQVILSEPALAEGKAYFRLAGWSVSPDARLIAYAADTSGAERFTLKVRDLMTGKDIETISDVTVGTPVWTADSKHVAWNEVNENWRSFRVRLHAVGSKTADRILYEEPDIGFTVRVGLSQDRRQLVLAAGDNVTSEVRLVPADNPTAAPVLIAARKAGREYDVDVRGRTVFVRVNDTHPNFRIVTAPLATPGTWTELIAPSDRHYLRGLTAFKSYLAVMERKDGLDQIRLRRDDGSDTYVSFPEASYTASVASNEEADAPLLRLTYTSMVTPTTTYDYDVATAKLVTRKVQEVPSGYDPTQYETVRIMARARDGAQVPVSVVYKKGFKKDGSGKLHVYAYGAYGIAVPPAFSTKALSLLDRGFAYAIAHIRGGDDLGYQWYLDGKLTKRTNTFNDFVDVTRALIGAGYAKAGNVSASGGSAGGELMGAIVNQAPELYRAIVADVPFVDVLNTMLDTSLPLTPGEWPEWGNPIKDKAAFALIRSYSPYDNVTAKAYPAMLITGGLNDPRVTYWEPAKWAAKLRATKTDDNLLLLKINMGAGHGGKSGRFEALRETAEAYAFILTQFDAATPARANARP